MKDTHFLFGASSLGALVALLGFPLIAEPLFGATRIGMGWAMAFVALGGLSFGIGPLCRGAGRAAGKNSR